MAPSYQGDAFAVSDMRARMAFSYLQQSRRFSLSTGDVLMFEALMVSSMEIAESPLVTWATRAEYNALRAQLAADLCMLTDYDVEYAVSVTSY